MKKLLFILFAMMFTIGCANAYPIDINYNDGIYHIVLKGENRTAKEKIFLFYTFSNFDHCFFFNEA